MIRFVCITLILGLLPQSVVAGFSDVPDRHPYSTAIAYVESRGIISGYTDGTFRPNRSVNRAEFTKMIAGTVIPSLGIERCIRGQGQPFRDVPLDAWFAPYVCAAKLTGIIEGYSDGTFRPDDRISFAEAAAVIVRSFTIPISGSSQPWFRPYIEALQSKRAIPTSIQSFTSLINRGETAEIIRRLREEDAQQSSHWYDSLAGRASVLTASNSKQAGLFVRSIEPDREILSALRREMLTLLNAEREKVGVGPLEYSDLLEKAAQAYADDMLKNNYYGGDTHRRIDGTNFADGISAAGYTIDNLADCSNCEISRAIAENIAKGQPSPAIVMRDWMNSESHRRNILSPDLDEVGFGIAGYDSNSPLWVQNFGSIRITQF